MESLWCVHLSYTFDDSGYDENTRVFLTADEALNFCYLLTVNEQAYVDEYEPDYMTLWRYEVNKQRGGFSASPEQAVATWDNLGEMVRR